MFATIETLVATTSLGTEISYGCARKTKNAYDILQKFHSLAG